MATYVTYFYQTPTQAQLEAIEATHKARHRTVKIELFDKAFAEINDIKRTLWDSVDKTLPPVLRIIINTDDDPTFIETSAYKIERNQYSNLKVLTDRMASELEHMAVHVEVTWHTSNPLDCTLKRTAMS